MPTNLHCSTGIQIINSYVAKKHRYVPVIGSKNSGGMQTFNIIVKNIQTHFKKHKIDYPGDF